MESRKTMEWKNTPDLYNQYVATEDAPPKMRKLLELYGWFFDEDYFYYHPKTTKTIIKRRPLYWYPQKGTPAEKRQPAHKGKQTKVSLWVK